MTIPDDIKQAARIACGEWNLIDAIARAILAERQRCADVAKRVWRDADFYGNEDMRKAASLIRCRIDTGSPT